MAAPANVTVLTCTLWPLGQGGGWDLIVTFSWTNSATAGVDFYELARQLPGEPGFTVIETVPAGVGCSGLVFDNRWPLTANGNITYRVRAHHPIDGYSTGATVAVAVTPKATWMIGGMLNYKESFAPQRPTNFPIVVSQWASSMTGPSAEYRPLGGSYPVIVTGARAARHGTMTVSLTAAEADKAIVLEEFAQAQNSGGTDNVIALRSPFGDVWIGQISNVSRSRMGGGAQIVSFAFVETAAATTPLVLL